MSAAERLADQRAIALSASLEVQLDRDAATRPMLAILAKAREQAAIAMNTLIYADPTLIELVRTLQYEVRRYDDLVAWCKEIITAGLEADKELTEADRSEFAHLLLSPEIAEEARALGANPRDYDA